MSRSSRPMSAKATSSSSTAAAVAGGAGVGVRAPRVASADSVQRAHRSGVSRIPRPPDRIPTTGPRAILTDGNRLSPLLLQPFSGLFSRTTWVSRYQKGKTSPRQEMTGSRDAVASAGPYSNNLHLALNR